MESLLFSLDGREDLANSIIEKANNWSKENKTTLGLIRTQKFSDSELSVDFTSSVRGKRVYILSSPNTSDEIIKLMLALDSAKRASAREIIPILPYFPYSRGDKKDYSRGPIPAKIMAEMIERCGATSIITFDLHADQIQGFFNIPVTHIENKYVFDETIYNHSTIMTDIVLAGPDAGSGKKVKRMKDQLQKHYGLNVNYIMLDKTRKEANVIDDMIIIGDVKDKNVFILDDMVDTSGTLCKAADVLMDAGAKSVRAIISHGVLSGPAYDRISKSKLARLIISDSLETTPNEKIGVVSIADVIGLALAANNNDMSYEALKLAKEKLTV